MKQAVPFTVTPGLGIIPEYQPVACVLQKYIAGGAVGICVPPGPTKRIHRPRTPDEASSQSVAPEKLIFLVESEILTYDEHADGRKGTK